MDRNQSLGSAVDRGEAQLFCGREPELEQLARALDRSRRQATLVSLSGIGGVGKSTLLREFMRRVGRQGLPILRTSADNHATPIAVMRDWVDQMVAMSHSDLLLIDFITKSQRLNTIELRLRNTISSDETPAGKVVVEAAKGGVSSAAGAIVGGSLGPVGAILGGLIGGALGPIVEAVSHSVTGTPAAKQLSTSDAAFLETAELELTNSLLTAIDGLTFAQGLVLVVDAVEYWGDETWHWFRDKLLASMANQSLLIVLASREPLRRDQWLVWLPRLVNIELQPFEATVTADLLRRYGVSASEAQLNLIQRQTAGLPLTLALMASQNLLVSQEAAAVSADTSGQLTQVIETGVEWFLRTINEVGMRDVVTVVSIPRWFNAELIDRLMQPEQLSGSYDFLRNLHSIVRPRPNGLSLHDAVRHYLARSISLRRPVHYRDLHQRASDYFAEWRRRLHVIGHAYSDEWQVASLEWMYHELSLGRTESLRDEVQRSSRFYQHTYTRKLLADIDTYQKDIAGIADVYAYHQGESLIHHNDFLGAIKVFERLRTSSTVTDSQEMFAGLVHYQLGKAHFWLGNLAEAALQLHTAWNAFRAMGNSRMVQHAATFMSRTREAQGLVDEALRWRRMALVEMRRLRIVVSSDAYERDRADRVFAVAEALRLRGSLASALLVHQQCLKDRVSLGNLFDLGESHLAVASCLLQTGRLQEVEEHLSKAEHIFTQTQDAYMLADVSRLKGERFVGLCERQQARGAFQRAADLAEMSQHQRCLAAVQARLNMLGDDTAGRSE